ncbi:adiponectin receptor protein 2 [Anolis sagrei]|uniref:adiponectin receptor protein 2 n=1 Tax=Anolis sagrei TaxID=38937 RepID=UPI00295BE91C|nr:adiponectin receptor protein 2 [Anolis sagrei ordinatus]XP_060632695.1 adiponectin receptor protein 2 [Anolis sagrei ordinatus]
MNESTDLGDANFLEPVLRLRKGHIPDPAEQENHASDQSSEQGSLLVEPTTSSQNEKHSNKDEGNSPTQEDEGFMARLPLLQAHHAMERMEEFVFKVWEGRWRVIPFDVLPDWLKDNDYLLHGHRPPMPSFRACFKSIFRIHTETGNIWTHLLGCVFFLCLGIFYMFRPNMTFVAPLQEKVVVGVFFLGAILCLSFSWLFHTVYCHSEGVSRVFSKLDYSGIALLIMGSFVPWLYYSFYCNPQPYFIYLIVICVLGIAAIIVSQWDRFATPQYRGFRAGVFLALGLSGVIPTLHFVISEGLLKAATMGQIGWLALMACLYITGAALYAARIPERFFPGKCDIWFHSHQLFHVFVVAGAFVHFHGVSNLQEFRFTVGGGCSEDEML